MILCFCLPLVITLYISPICSTEVFLALLLGAVLVGCTLGLFNHIYYRVHRNQLLWLLRRVMSAPLTPEEHAHQQQLARCELEFLRRLSE